MQGKEDYTAMSTMLNQFIVRDEARDPMSSQHAVRSFASFLLVAVYGPHSECKDDTALIVSKKLIALWDLLRVMTRAFRFAEVLELWMLDFVHFVLRRLLAISLSDCRGHCIFPMSHYSEFRIFLGACTDRLGHKICTVFFFLCKLSWH